MEPAGQDRQAGRQKGACQIDCARKLVRLNADQTDQSAAAAFTDRADDALWPYTAVGFSISVKLDVDIRP